MIRAPSSCVSSNDAAGRVGGQDELQHRALQRGVEETRHCRGRLGGGDRQPPVQGRPFLSPLHDGHREPRPALSLASAGDAGLYGPHPDRVPRLLELRRAVARREHRQVPQPVRDRVRHPGPDRQRSRQPRTSEQREHPVDDVGVVAAQGLLGGVPVHRRDQRAFEAHRVDRWMLDRVWVPVGQGVKTQEQVDALALYLFDDEQGEEELLGIDEKIGRLPGLSGIKLMSRALYTARDRRRENPEWAWRLIDNEEWAVTPPRKSPIGALTTRRMPAEAPVMTAEAP